MAKLYFENGAAIAKALMSHDPISTTVMFSFRPRTLYVQGIHPTNRETYCLGIFDAHMDLMSALCEPGPDLDMVVLQNSNAFELKEFWKQKDMSLLVQAEPGRGVHLLFANGRPVLFSVPPSSCVSCAFFNPQRVMRQLCANAKAQGSVAIHIPSAEFQHIIKDFAIVGSHLAISFNPVGKIVTFRSQGENLDMWLDCGSDQECQVHIGANEPVEPFTCNFVINHIKMITKGICNSDRLIVLTISKDAPMLLNHGITDDNNLFILFAQLSEKNFA